MNVCQISCYGTAVYAMTISNMCFAPCDRLQRLEGTTDIMADINSNERSEGLGRHYELIPPNEDNIVQKFIDRVTGFLFRTTDQNSNNKDTK